MSRLKHSIEQGLAEFAHHTAIAFPIIKRLFSPLYKLLYKDHNQAKKNRLFLKNGLDTLREFDKCMTENDIYYTLAFGTMLGAVREHGFIKHDLDIDVFVYNEDYSDSLQAKMKKYGFVLIHSFVVDDGNLGREETYLYKGITIDIFYIYPPINELPYCCDFLAYENMSTFRESMRKCGGVLARRIELPLVKKRKLVAFESTEFYVPINAEEILEFRYGKDYMQPNPHWEVRSHDTHIIEWRDKVGIFTDYE